MIRWYKQNDAHDVSLCIPPETLERVATYLDGVLAKRTTNCCMHYGYILMKSLETIGEVDCAAHVKEVFALLFAKRKAQYEETWTRFISTLSPLPQPEL